MDIYDNREFDGHELVIFGHDAATGLKAIIAINSTALGPAAGGCRMWPYATTADALTDVLRLSRGMSYKNAMAGLPFGGGKAVIIGDARATKTPELFAAFGRMVDALRGRYVTAEDVGTTTADMAHVSRVTRYVSGLGRSAGQAAGGDPAPKTALGVFLGLRAAVKFRLGRSDLEGLTVVVQGVGGVGYHLCGMLATAGARLKVADVVATSVERACDEFGATSIPPVQVLEEEADVLAPCALGAILNARSIARLRVPVIAGAANNQLARNEDGEALRAAGILYAPDYVINAGGIISVAREYYGGTEGQVIEDIQGIPARLTEIFERARRENRPTSEVADAIARERLRLEAPRLVA